MANPPVCRIMDYGKFRYEESQKAKESRKKTVQVSIKEVKFRPKIGKGDFDTKVRHMQDFLADGHKVKVTLQFRGREMAHPELGSKILDAVIEQLGPDGKVETHGPARRSQHDDGAGSREEGSRQEAARTTSAVTTTTPQRQPTASRRHGSPTTHRHRRSRQQPDSSTRSSSTEVQTPAEPVSEAVVETADPA